MTKRLTLEDAQKRLDDKYPNRFKLLTYNGFHSKCNFIWLETQDEDSICYFRFNYIDDVKIGRFPPSKRKQEFDKRKHSLQHRQQIVYDRSGGQASLTYWDPITYKVTLRWSSGEENVIDWRHIIDRRKERIYPLSTEKERTRQTSFQRYGVSHPSQCREIALKIACKVNQPCIKIHWKTNETLICQGSYEALVVDYFNQNCIDFLWQHKIFQLTDGKTYRPDCYLIAEDKWIEIKGYFWEDARDKWEEFHSKIQTNSELWSTTQLQKMGLLKKRSARVISKK